MIILALTPAAAALLAMTAAALDVRRITRAPSGRLSTLSTVRLWWAGVRS